MKPAHAIFGSATLACLVAGPSFATDYLSIEAAQKLCFPTAAEFQVSHVFFTPQQRQEIEKESGIPVSNKAQKIWRVAGSDGQALGWFVVDYVIGKHLLIDYAVAIDANKKVSDVEILSYRESYGGEIRSQGWLNQFTGKTEDSPLTLDKDISNIGGATLSSRHVTEGIKRILATIDVTQK